GRPPPILAAAPPSLPPRSRYSRRRSPTMNHLVDTPYLLPRIGGLLRHAAPRVLEGAIAPVAVFLLALHFLSVTGAVVAGLGFAYSAIGWGGVTGRRGPRGPGPGARG